MHWIVRYLIPMVLSLSFQHSFTFSIPFAKQLYGYMFGNQEEVEEVNEHPKINDYRLDKAEKWRDCIAIPQQMHELEYLEIVHLQALRQKGSSCSWHQVLNAFAITWLHAEHQSITSDAIMHYIDRVLIPKMRNHEELLKKTVSVEQLWERMTDIGKIKLANFFNLTQYYVLSLESQAQWCLFYSPQLSNELSPYCDPSQYRDTYGVKSPPHFLNKIIIEGEPVHFLLSAPAEFGSQDNHAVLVTVLRKQAAQRLTVIYMDSNNVPLGDNHEFWVLPSALYRFFQALNETAFIKTSC